MAQQHHWDFSTRAVHVGNEVDKDTGAIRHPITMANSYALPYDPTDMNFCVRFFYCRIWRKQRVFLLLISYVMMML